MLPERAPIAPAINFEVILKHLWADSVQGVKRDHKAYDAEALDALSNEKDPGRWDKIRNWLQAYKVFRVRGIANQKDKIAEAVLAWADSRDRNRDLESPAALSIAHQSLMESVCDAYVCDSQNKRRDFVSLASKALWLCYPDKIPMFDSYAQRALWVLAKLETGLRTPPGRYGYHPFVSVWKDVYEKYAATINDLPTDGYQYRVRVFDRILWQIGMDQYSIPAP